MGLVSLEKRKTVRERGLNRQQVAAEGKAMPVVCVPQSGTGSGGLKLERAGKGVVHWSCTKQQNSCIF